MLAPLSRSLLLLLVVLRLIPIVGGERLHLLAASHQAQSNHTHHYNFTTINTSLASARRDIDIVLQADDAPLSGSLLGLVNAPISYQYYYASASSSSSSNNNTNASSSVLKLINATARIVGVTQSEGGYSVRADTPSIPTTARAVLTGACPAGQFNSDPYTCTQCPWGFWCPTGGSAAIACGAGTANPVAGAAFASACVPCVPGTYAPTSGAPLCMACPPGSYCAAAAAAPTKCPAHTSSSAGGSSLLDCACDADYACTYARSVTLRLTLDTALSVQELQSDASIASTLNSAFLMAMGLYGMPGVTATFKGFVPDESSVGASS